MPFPHSQLSEHSSRESPEHHPCLTHGETEARSWECPGILIHLLLQQLLRLFVDFVALCEDGNFPAQFFFFIIFRDRPDLAKIPENFPSWTPFGAKPCPFSLPSGGCQEISALQRSGEVFPAELWRCSTRNLWNPHLSCLTPPGCEREAGAERDFTGSG